MQQEGIKLAFKEAQGEQVNFADGGKQSVSTRRDLPKVTPPGGALGWKSMLGLQTALLPEAARPPTPTPTPGLNAGQLPEAQLAPLCPSPPWSLGSCWNPWHRAGSIFSSRPGVGERERERDSELDSEGDLQSGEEGAQPPGSSGLSQRTVSTAERHMEQRGPEQQHHRQSPRADRHPAT